MSQGIVSIKRKAAAPGGAGGSCKHGTGPVADKFFLMAILGSLLALGWYGAHLWLMRSGEMPFRPNYLAAREIHAVSGIFLFLGTLVMGFSFQAGGRIFGSALPRPRWAIICAILPTLGFILIASGAPAAGKSVISAAFLLTLKYVVALLRDSRNHGGVRPQGVMLAFALSAFAAAVFTDFTDPYAALVAFWGSMGAAMLATAAQFIMAFGGGVELAGKRLLTVHLLFGLSFLAGVFAVVFRGTAFIDALYAVLMLLTLVGYGRWSGLFARAAKGSEGIIRPVFFAAFVWAVSGALYLLISGPIVADYVLHLYALGWITPIAIALTLHIISFLSGSDVLPRSVIAGALITWQLAVIGRGAAGIIPLPAHSAAAVGIIVLTVLLIWITGAARGVRLIIIRHASGRHSKAMANT